MRKILTGGIELRQEKGGFRVGKEIVEHSKMALRDVPIGFSIARFVDVSVPKSFWEALFLANVQGVPGWLVAIENAVVASFVAVSTFSIPISWFPIIISLPPWILPMVKNLH